MLTYFSDPQKSILALVMMVVLLFTVLSYTGQLYEDPTKFSVRHLPEKVSFRSILEISFPFNLAVVGGLLLYFNDTKTNAQISVACTSV